MNDKLLLLINGWAGKNSLLDNLMVFCAKDLIYVVFLVGLICVVYLMYKREWKQISYFALTLVVSFALLELAAHLYVDHRPFTDHKLTQLIAHAAGKSFPSDHTTATTAIALGLLFFTRFKKVGLVVLVAAFLIGFARIFTGLHYPVDILGGLVTGLVGALVTLGIYKIVPMRRPANTVASDEAIK